MDFLGSVAESVAGIPGISSTQTPAAKQLRPILCDESIQVLSTFELNQVASLTYNDVTCDGIFEFIQSLCSKPAEQTPLTLQKSLIVTKHIVIYGSEKTVNHAYGLQHCLKPLLEFNTVLLAQQQGGAMSFLQKMQGGAVDKGGPVREAALQLWQLLGNINELRRLRLESASENSLVPVGNAAQVGFVTDRARHEILQRKLAEEKRIRIQSNLKKSEGGFGGGYASKDGRTVVGAAHGIEEMIKMANRSTPKQSKFSDDGMPREKTREELILEELKAEADAAKAAANPPTADLLGSSYGAASATAATGASADLLDFGASSSASHTATAPAVGDLLGGGMHMPSGPVAAADPFGLASAYNNPTTISSSSTATTAAAMSSSTMAQPNPASSSLLDFSVQNDPFAPIAAAPNPSLPSDSTGLMGMTMNSMAPNNATPTMNPMNHLAAGMNSMSLAGPSSMTGPPPLPSSPPPSMPSAPPPTPATVPPPPMAMAMGGTSSDRFSALDALANSAPAPPIPSVSQTTAAQDAEARLLGFSSGGPMAPPPAAAAPGFSPGGPMAPPPAAAAPPLPPMVAPGSGQVATAYGGTMDPYNNITKNNSDGDDNPWVMGGTLGMGLQPVGPEPTAPPPPPPPDY